MEQNYFAKFLSVYNNNNQNGLKNNKYSKLDKSNILFCNKEPDLFHVDCKFTKKKICHCKNYNFSKSSLRKKEGNLSSFINDLAFDNIEISTNNLNKKVRFERKFNHAQKKCQMEMERMRQVNYKDIKKYLKKFDENNLSLNEYEEIEKNINEDRKICENCKALIYENTYHKAWKNENGEHVLLCPLCSKKYLSGALEIKFERNEMIPNNQGNNYRGNMIRIQNETMNSALGNANDMNTNNQANQANQNNQNQSKKIFYFFLFNFVKTLIGPIPSFLVHQAVDNNIKRVKFLIN